MVGLGRFPLKSTEITEYPTPAAVQVKKTLSLDDPEELLNLFVAEEKIRKKLLNPALKFPPTLLETLRQKRLPGETVKSFDGLDSYTVFEQYLGSYCYQRFENLSLSSNASERLYFFDMACSFKFFSALKARMNVNAETLKSSNFDAATGAYALAQLKEDAATFGNTFWSLGFLHSALIFLDIGNHLANQGNLGGGDEYQKIALEKFYYANELAKYSKLPTDKKIIEQLCGKKGLEVFEFKSWDSAEDFFLLHVRPSEQPHENEKLYNQLRLKAQQDVHAKVGVRETSRSASPTPKKQ